MTEKIVERIPGLFEIAQSRVGKFIYEQTEEPIEKTPAKIGAPLIIPNSKRILEDIAESWKKHYIEANAYEFTHLDHQRRELHIQFYRILP